MLERCKNFREFVDIKLSEGVTKYQFQKVFDKKFRGIQDGSLKRVELKELLQLFLNFEIPENEVKDWLKRQSWNAYIYIGERDVKEDNQIKRD